MGRVWLCTGRIAEHPLLLESEGVGLSSFEELCYYLYWNAELVGESFYNERLCQWLEEELGLAALASSLRRGIGGDVGSHLEDDRGFDDIGVYFYLGETGIFG